MSTLEGAVPLGLGITKLRLWDELHRAHCQDLQQSHSLASVAPQPSQPPPQHCDAATQAEVHSHQKHQTRSTTVSSKRSHQPDTLSTRHKQRRIVPPLASKEAYAIDTNVKAPSLDMEPFRSYRTGCMDWLWTDRDPSQGSNSPAHDTNQATNKSYQGPARDSQGVLMPPPPRKPGPSRRKPPPLVARIKAKARRAKRKQQKAEYRRRLFLAHTVQATQTARRQNAAKHTSSQPSVNKALAPIPDEPKESASGPTVPHAQQARQALFVFPESLGVELASFVEIVFDTDAQSSEITAPSDISDDDLAWATRTEIETRKKLGGADVVVPKGVFRWMVARDFAERWPQKVKDVRKNPWPGLEDVWGSPSGSTATEVAVSPGRGQFERDGEPFRWQSGRRSGFIRRKEKVAPPTAESVEASLAQVRAPDRLSVKAVSPPGASTDATAAAVQVPSVISKAHVLQSPTNSAHLPTTMPSSRAKAFAVEPYGPQKTTNSTPSKAVPSSVTSTPRSQPNKVSDPFGKSDSFASSWDWSSALTCSRSTALPSTLGSLPISLWSQ